MEAARDPKRGEHPAGPRPLPDAPGGDPPVPTTSGSGGGGEDAARIVDALKSSAEQELTIAERISGKARQGFALGAGVFVVAQTVAFGSFEAANIRDYERTWIIALAIGAVAMLALAAFATVKADAPVDSRDLPLGKIEDDLNAAYEGDDGVMGRLGGYYLGVVRTRRDANDTRRTWYKRARFMVVLSLFATVAELVVSLIARAS